jgi:hypothetical protein
MHSPGTAMSKKPIPLRIWMLRETVWMILDEFGLAL